MLILNGRDTYINTVSISKDFIVDLSIITNIRYEGIMIKWIVSLKNKSYRFNAKLARYTHIK
jgi:hypothetical protein